VSLVDRLLKKRDARIRQQERDRLLALAKGDIKGCSGLYCEECERLSLINDIVEECIDGENK
jgi:N-acetylglutamate synthase-like GNAT family acetyltransferase